MHFNFFTHSSNQIQTNARNVTDGEQAKQNMSQFDTIVNFAFNSTLFLLTLPFWLIYLCFFLFLHYLKKILLNSPKVT